MNPYPFEVRFTKAFVNGPLSGRRIQETVRFATRSAAIFYAKQDGYLISPAAGLSDYRIEDARVVEVQS